MNVLNQPRKTRNAANRRIKTVIRVPTYQGDSSDVISGFAKPIVPVSIEKVDGVVLTLGKPTKTRTAPEVICERRRNGWCIFVAPEAGGDSNLLVYIIDSQDGAVPETVVVMDGVPSRHPRVEKYPPEEIDREQVKYEEVGQAPEFDER